MKRILVLLFPLIMLFGGCVQKELQESLSAASDGRIFTASFEQNETRTYVEEGNLLRWNAGDQISLFDGNTLNRQYRFDGETGDNAGTFSIVSKPFGTGNDLDCHYAVYPYSSDVKITENGTLTVTLPAGQSYAENSFGLGANTMVAVTKDTDDTFLKFKNVCGYLKLQLYGINVNVKSITLTGNGNDKIAGKAYVSPVYGQEPVATMADDATSSITLNCGEGVRLGATAENATAFWITVPPVTFEEGFTITVTGTNDKTFTKSTSKEISIERNVIQPMKTFKVDIEADPIPENQIWYTSTDGDIVVPYSNKVFGANFISNTYENGQGVITFDGNVTSIGKSAFMYCNDLETIILPGSVTYISDNAFDACKGLVNIMIPESVGSLGKYAFNSCQKLHSISLPSSIKSIGECAFRNCSVLSDIVLPDNLTLISDSMFANCASLSDITLPANTTSIGSYAFSGCNLTSINIPDKVASIGGYAFQHCNLIDLTLPASVTSIGHNAFDGSSGELVINCNIPLGQSISTRPFYNTSFTKVIIGDTVTSIGRLAFYGCTSLSSLTIGKNVTSIGESAFSGCNLTNVILPDSITSLGESVFYGCSLLTEITIGNGLTAIPADAFMNSGLIDLIIPGSVISIGEAAFYNCTGLKSVTIPDSVTTIGKQAFSKCSSLQSVTIPDSMTAIMNETFYACTSLTSVTMPNSITSIGSSAFAYCQGLTSVTIPESVTNIGSMLFYGCHSLTRADVKPLSPPAVASNPFQECNSEIKVYVPAESLEAYKSASVWKHQNLLPDSQSN